MSDSNKAANLKEKLRQALISTYKVISDEFEVSNKSDQHKNSDKFDLIELENLNTKGDFIKMRAETDSSALKKNFLMMIFTKKIYLPIHLINHFIL